MVNPDDVDQFRALAPDGKPLKQKEAMEIILDHENGELGFALKLPKTHRDGLQVQAD